ncbi:MAG: hypothetical protein RMI94_05685 [Bryobacterales bacterium]|nr:hypothetical protein [Bryobacteraceae bacterium]MDW8130021.1 hypothetical protein [Bryobacterales bacterium]
MYFRFTLFNSLTLLVMAASAAMIWIRLRFSVEKTWPLGYYAILIAYSEAFPGSLSPYAVFGGVVCGLLLRFEFMGGAVLQSVRVIEMGIFGYVLVRGTQLLLMLPW